MMQIKAAASAAVLLLFLTGVSLAGKAMPAFSLSSAADAAKKVSSEEFKGKVVLVSFFATWCPPCREEIPDFIALQNNLGAKGFSVLGIAVDEGGSEAVKQLVEQEKINYPVAMTEESVMAGFGGISGVPTSFLINRKGNVVKHYPGYVPHQVLQKDIEQVMQEQ